MASIRERKGSYQITVSCGYDVNGKKITETATYTPPSDLTPKKKEKAIQEFARQFEERIRNGFAMDGRHITLKEFTDRWLEEYASANLEQTTVAKYREEIDGKIIPALGHLKLTEIRPHTVNSFLASLRSDNAKKGGGAYSRSTIKKAFAVLSSILKTAEQWEVIDSNPCQKVTVPAVPDIADNLKFFTPEQAILFLNFIDMPYSVSVSGHKRVDDTGKPYTVQDYTETRMIPTQFRVLYNLALFGGLRKGELLALQWSDVDWESKSISITKSAGVVNGTPVIKCPKTKTSKRIVCFPESVMKLLRQHYVEQTQTRLSVGDYWQNEGWLFTQSNGKRMDYSTPAHSFRDTLLRYNQNAAEPLPLIPFHGLRHTSATLLISSHQDIRTVSARLGHSQTSTTLNVYAHALKEADVQSANALESMLRKQA